MLHNHATTIIKQVIADNMPQKSVNDALCTHNFNSYSIYVVAIGKAAWTMASVAHSCLGNRIKKGIVITKYGHSMGKIPNMTICEAGHPILDENTVVATKKALALVENLGQDDEVLFLVSGGGSALFEAPMDGIELKDLAGLSDDLLASGADIIEINTVRKRLSKVKAGRFAELVSPAKIFSIVLSDVLGDRLDTIASGPAAVDNTTSHDALYLVEKYGLKLNQLQMDYLMRETPKTLNNVETRIIGSVRSLCESVAASAKHLGFTPYIITTTLNCEAASAGMFLASIARDIKSTSNSDNATHEGTYFKRPCAIIAGGETIVKLTGKGKGGRNQELALSAARGIAGLSDILIFSIGSDGTDGPTDAAGGIVDGETMEKLVAKGYSINKILAKNDSYNGLLAADGLIKTGPTGTNVNDVAVVLCV